MSLNTYSMAARLCRQKIKKRSFQQKICDCRYLFSSLLLRGIKQTVAGENYLMSEEQKISEAKDTAKLGDRIQAKVSRMKESEGLEIELSETDLEDVDGAGYKISACVSYETSSK
jgi:hypothetical protein